MSSSARKPSPPVATGFDPLPEEAYAAALASVPGIGPRTLRALLADRTPRGAWEALVTGSVRLAVFRQAAPALGQARRLDVEAIWRAHLDAGVGVRMLGRPGYPAVLAADPEAPAVLFSLGDPRVLDRAARVAIVGTRSATRYGLGVAAELGADLAAAGVVVLSGLALGIDGAAHEGAVAAWRASSEERAVATNASSQASGAVSHAGRRAAPPVGVVAGSVAVPYPRQHAGLWRRVAQAGAVLSEAPLGVADLAWRFPMRNRIIAALSDVVVVVECHTRGGSLHTVQAATARGVPVGAVPGSVRSPASAGTNALLADGCFVVRDASDVLVAVGLRLAGVAQRGMAAGVPSEEPVGVAQAVVAGVPQAGAPAEEPAIGDDALPSPTREVVAAVGWDRTSLDEVLERTGLEMDAVCGALERLRARGIVHGEGGWWERE